MLNGLNSRFITTNYLNAFINFLPKYITYPMTFLYQLQQNNKLIRKNMIKWLNGNIKARKTKKKQ